MTSLVFEKLAQSLAANQVWPLQIAGDFFRVESAEWPVTVEIMNGGRVVGRMANVRAGDFVREIAFDQVRVINGATAQSVTAQIAGGGVGSDRVAGEVSVIDGAKLRTLAGTAFMASRTHAPLAGNYAFMQLLNPVASGVRVVLQEIVVAVAAAGQSVQIAPYDTPLLTLHTVDARKLLAAGAPSSKAQVRYEEGATPLGVGIFSFVGAVNSAAIATKDPIVLGEGKGVMLKTTTVGAGASIGFQWFEEPL